MTAQADDIIAAAADWARVTPEVIRGPRRSAQLSRARHVAMALCKERLGMSFPEIGRAFAYRCHTTVMNGVKRARAGRLNREEHWLVAFEGVARRIRIPTCGHCHRELHDCDCEDPREVGYQ